MEFDLDISDSDLDALQALAVLYKQKVKIGEDWARDYAFGAYQTCLSLGLTQAAEWFRQVTYLSDEFEEVSRVDSV